jgi:hypothetical protein
MEYDSQDLPKPAQDVVENPYYLNRITTTSCLSVSLTEKTLGNLKITFDNRGLSPSPEMWTGLRSAIQVMVDMAEGTCAPAYYVSSLDPGVGKTTAMVDFLRELVISQDYQGVSALVCLGRLDQIKNVIDEASLQDQDFAVLTARGNEDLNSLGCGVPEVARILFTTHAMVEKRCSKTSFRDSQSLWFQGQPRQVKIWDEAILLGHPVTLGRDSLASLFSILRPRHPEFTKALEGFFNELGDAKDKSFLHVPSIHVSCDVAFHDVSGLFVQESEATQKALEDLWFLMGKTVVVRIDGPAGATLVNYRQTLPNDIKPILILDASARVRATYDLWEKHRGDLVRLPSATKNYSNLTINVWDHAGGKSAYRTEGDRIVQGVLKAIDTKPDEEWLVIHHKFKPTLKLDLPTKVTERFSQGHKISFLNWGSHDGTNEFKDVSNVVLAGTLFYPNSYKEGLARLASGQQPSMGTIRDDQVKATESGEHSHLILQALCRSSVRQNQDGECPPVNAYLIASTYSGIKELLPEVFPGAQIVPWMPVPREVRGQVADAIEFVRCWFRDNPDGVLPLKDLKTAVGVKDASNFRNTIRQHKDFLAALEEMGLEEWGPGQYPKYLRKKLTGFGAAA